MTALRSIDGTPPAIHPRPVSGEPIDSWAALDAYLVRREAAFRVDFEDDETAQSIGLNKQWMSRGRVAILMDLRAVIAPMVAAEAAESADTADAESVEQQYKAAGFDDMPPTIQRLMDGDR